MNETSRGDGGGGDDASGGATAAAANSTASAAAAAAAESPSAAATSTAAAASASSDQLPSLGMELEDGPMTLSRLLAGESSTHTWGDFDPLAHSAAGGGSYRPWEMDLAVSSIATTAGATVTTAAAASSLTRLMSAPQPGSVAPAAAPPNVLAPPTSRPPSLHHAFYQPPAHHYIDQRLPPFQSQFHQQQAAETFAAAAGGGGNQYPLVPAPVQARELQTIHQQFLDERQIHAPPQPPNQGSYHQLQPRSDAPGGYPGTSRAPAAAKRPAAAAAATIVEQHPTLTAQLRKKTNRAGSLDTGDGDGGGGSGNQPPDTPGQVAAISSTDQAQSGLTGGGAGGGGAAAGHSSSSAPGFKSPGNGSSPGGQVTGKPLHFAAPCKLSYIFSCSVPPPTGEGVEEEAKALRRVPRLPAEGQLRRLRSVQERQEPPNLQGPALREAHREEDPEGGGEYSAWIESSGCRVRTLEPVRRSRGVVFPFCIVKSSTGLRKKVVLSQAHAIYRKKAAADP